MKLPDGARYLPLPQILPPGGSGQLRDLDPALWFSALPPVPPVANVPIRQWPFPIASNISWTPGAEGGADVSIFRVLREVADSWDLLRLVIDTVKDKIGMQKLEARLIPEVGELQNKVKARQQKDPRIAAVNKFLKSPDGELMWAQWIKMALEELLVLDALAVYKERDLTGKIASWRVIAGDSINRLITDQGFTPGPGQPAYQQVLYGYPTSFLTTDDMFYFRRNPRAHRRYGQSPVSMMLNVIAIGLYNQRFLLNWFKEGNMPEALAFLPSSLNFDRVKEIQDWFDTIMVGDMAQRRRLTFLPGFGDGKEGKPNIVFTKEALLKDPFLDWQFQVICYGLGTSPQQLLRMMNRATAMSSAEQAEEEGLGPKMRDIEALVSHLIQSSSGFGFDDVEAAFPTPRETDGLKQMEIDTGYVKCAGITINEMRHNMGQDPRKEPEADMLGVMTQNGWLPITGGVIGVPNSGSDPLPQPEPQPKGQESQSSGGKEPKPGGKPPKKQPQSGKKAFEVHCAAHEEYDGDCLQCAVADYFEVEKVVLKAGKKKQPSINPGYSTAKLNKAQAALAEKIKKIFRRQKDRAIARTSELMKAHAEKAVALRKSDDAESISAQIYEHIQSVFNELPADSAASLEQAVNEGIAKGITELAISDVELINKVNIIAKNWASERAAEMVGMKYNEDGVLVENPDPKWAISETTRDNIKSIITSSFEDEKPLTKIIDDLKDATAFSDQRAEMIARTEVQMAQIEGNVQVWKQSGLVDQIEWATSEDANSVCEICDGNDGEVVAFGEPFPSGDLYPLAHVQCQCVVFAVKITEDESESE